MRAPSAQLLRALRRVVDPASFAESSPTLRRTVSPLNSHRSKATSRPSISSQTTSRCTRAFSTSPVHHDQSPPPSPAKRSPPRSNPYAPTHTDRGPRSTEDTQTDFGAMDVLANIATPATSIDACTTDGFHLNNGVRITGGSGIVLVGGEAWGWRPWTTLASETSTTQDLAERKIGDLLDARRGILDLPKESLALLEVLYPKPDLLIVGTGSRLWMLSKETRRYIAEVLGCKLDVMDTGNASAAYNLLAKERGVDGGGGVGALLLPLGWKGRSN